MKSKFAEKIGKELHNSPAVITEYKACFAAKKKKEDKSRKKKKENRKKKKKEDKLGLSCAKLRLSWDIN